MPDGWPRPHRSIGRLFGVLVFAVFTLLCVALVVVALLSGAPWRALIWALGAVLMADVTCLVGSLLIRPGQVDPTPVRAMNDRGVSGVAFVYSRWPYLWLSVALGGFVLILAGYTVAALSNDAGAASGLAVVFFGICGYMLWLLVTMWRTAPGMVVLTPDGIYHRALAFEHFVPWESVSRVEACGGRNPWIAVHAQETEGTRTRNLMGRWSKGPEQFPLMIVRTQWLSSGSVAALRAMVRYHAHPEARAELAAD